MTISGSRETPAKCVREEEYSGKGKGERTGCTGRGARGENEAVERGSGRKESSTTSQIEG